MSESLECRLLLAGYKVDTTLDEPANGAGVMDGKISLREAIIAANTNQAFGDAPAGSPSSIDEIIFSTNLEGMTLTLGGEQLVISDDLNIEGLGVNQLTIDGNGNSRIFAIQNGAEVKLSDLTITGGDAADSASPVGTSLLGLGGAILNDRSILALQNVALVENAAIFGGGITNYGTGGTATLSIFESIISDNTSSDSGGGLLNWGNSGTADAIIEGSTFTGNSTGDDGGAILNWTTGATLHLINSTLSNNTAISTGGGLDNSGSATLTNTTITRNTSNLAGSSTIAGGGIYTGTGSVVINNTIVAGNFSGTLKTDNDVRVLSGTFNGFNNLIGDSASAGGLKDGIDGNIVALGDVGVMPITSILNITLENYGGPTPIHSLVAGSVAINSGNNSLAVDQKMNPLTTDQRGTGFSRILQSTVDIGAFEGAIPISARTYVVNTILDQPLNGSTATDNLLSLRVAITAANTNLPFGDAIAGSPDQVDVITFDSSLTGMTITLAGEQLVISDDLIIAGPGVTQLTIDANDNSRVFTVQGGIDATISDMTITGGDAVDSDPPVGTMSSGLGGGILNDRSNLTLQKVHVTQNTANYGGGINNYGDNGSATLIIVDSQVSLNTSAFSGAGLRNSANFGLADATIDRSTFNGNQAGINGGAISSVAVLNLFNSTISGNSANGQGGGLYTGNSTARVVNSTITANRADADNNSLAEGGGIQLFSGSMVLNNSIVAGNFSGNATTADDIQVNVGALNSSENLIGNAASSGGILNGNNGNIVGVNGSGTRLIATILDTTLQNNGGPTPTHALMDGSAALNAGSNSLAVDQSSTPFTKGQRGFTRFSGIVDMGAFERINSTNYFINTSIDEPSNGPGVTDGLISLREAVMAANTNAPYGDAPAGSPDYRDLIHFTQSYFSGGNKTITLDGEQLQLSEDVDIRWNDTLDQINIEAGGNSRHFEVLSGVKVVLRGLKLTGGIGYIGGSIYNSGDLTLNNLWITENSSVSNTSAGAIYNNNSSQMTILNSTISHNIAHYEGGAIVSRSDLSIINSTISNNSARGVAGGILSTGGFLNITNSTITGNHAFIANHANDSGGGIRVSLATVATFNNTIVAGNLDGSNRVANDIRLYDATLTGSNNLIGDAASAGGLTDGINGNIVGVNGSGIRDINTILDTSLQFTGGSIPTHVLVAGSVAINNGNNLLAVDQYIDALMTDQRGLIRVLDGTVEIGAVETKLPETYVVNTLKSFLNDGMISLREALHASNSNNGTTSYYDAPAGSWDFPDVIMFASSMNGTTYNEGALLGITDNLILIGSGTANTQIDRNFQSQLFVINASNYVLKHGGTMNVSISGMTLIRGQAPNGETGGAIQSRHTNLTLNNVVLLNNSTATTAIDVNEGSLSLVAVTQSAPGNFISRSHTSETAFRPQTMSSPIFSEDASIASPTIFFEPDVENQTVNQTRFVVQHPPVAFAQLIVAPAYGFDNETDVANVARIEASMFVVSDESGEKPTISKPAAITFSLLSEDAFPKVPLDAIEALDWDATLFANAF